MTKGRNTTPVCIRMPDELYFELKKRADSENKPLADFIRSVLAALVNGEVIAKAERAYNEKLSNESLSNKKTEANGRKLPDKYGRYPGTGRNELCPCGSGLKYKKCHGR